MIITKVVSSVHSNHNNLLDQIRGDAFGPNRKKKEKKTEVLNLIELDYFQSFNSN
jgi:hypothetical protein